MGTIFHAKAFLRVSHKFLCRNKVLYLDDFAPYKAVE